MTRGLDVEFYPFHCLSGSEFLNVAEIMRRDIYCFKQNSFGTKITPHMHLLDKVRDSKNRLHLLPPADVVCKGYVFTGVCLSMGVGEGGWVSQDALQVT